MASRLATSKTDSDSITPKKLSRSTQETKEMNSLGLNFRSADLNRRSAIKATAALGLGACLSKTNTQAFSLDETKGVSAHEWWTWRGPNGNNIAPAGSSAPTSYRADHLFWETPVPGRGHSSPIVAGNSIYLTTADKAAGSQSVLAYSCDNGKPLWSQVIHNTGLPKENHPKNTEASPSLAFDGQRLFAAFYNSSAIWLTAMTAEGKTIWQKSVGKFDPQKFKYGYAASPTLFKDLVTPSVVGNTMFMRLAKNLSGVRQEFLVALG